MTGHVLRKDGRPESAFPMARSSVSALPAAGLRLSVLHEVQRACAARGITLDTLGHFLGDKHAAPEAILPQYDLVFAKGRSALEAAAVGAAPCVPSAVAANWLPTNDNPRRRSAAIRRPTLSTARALGLADPHNVSAGPRVRVVPVGLLPPVSCDARRALGGWHSSIQCRCVAEARLVVAEGSCGGFALGASSACSPGESSTGPFATPADGMRVTLTLRVASPCLRVLPGYTPNYGPVAV